MPSSDHCVQVVKGKEPLMLVTRTTLYDLIAAISAEAQAGEDDLIAATMVHLLKVRKVIHLGTFKYRRLVVQARRASRPHWRKATVTRLREWP
jgi:hypothetical protein